VSVGLSVCHKPALCRYEWTNRAGFLPQRLPSSIHRVVKKFGYLRNQGVSSTNFVWNFAVSKFRSGASIVLSTKDVDSRAGLLSILTVLSD